MLHENIGLITRRQMLPPYGYFFVSDSVISDGVIRSDNRGGESLFPLYIYSEDRGAIKKEPNINPVFMQAISSMYEKEVSPEEICYYIYAIFYSNAYRTKYAEFLRSDFPRVPLTKNYKDFMVLSKIGQDIVNLHLMKTKLSSAIKFDVQGSNVVEFIEYNDGKVFINKEQFFEGVPEKAWNFYIGGYQVLDKWLKSRKKRELSSSEIEHFIQIVEIINQTIEYMKQIDEIKFLD